jgi:hypothetical protein
VAHRKRKRKATEKAKPATAEKAAKKAKTAKEPKGTEDGCPKARAS